MSVYERGSSPNMSMREKGLVKRRVNKEHNSNFRAGYISINEEQLHKTGIRGRKVYVIYFVTVFMVLAVLVNLLLTVVLFTTLRISRDGMAALEFTPGGSIVRFLQHSDMGDVYPFHNTLSSLPQQHLQVSGTNDQAAKLVVKQKGGSFVSVGSSKIEVVSEEGFQVIDPDSGLPVFSTNFDNPRIPEGIQHIELKDVVTNRVTSDVNERLHIVGDNKVLLQGAEGVSIETKAAEIRAKDDIMFTAGDEVVLSTDGSYLLEQVAAMSTKPSVPATSSTSRGTEGGATGNLTGNAAATVMGYKVCVCVPSGKVFAVDPEISCAMRYNDENPCMKV